MKCIFLYNPNSGKGKLLKKLDYIEQRLKEKFDEVVIYPTKSMADTVETSKKACGVYDALIFSGGDGTFNDVTCGISGCENRPILGYIPSGTANDIAHNLKIKKNLKKALKVIIDGNTTYHDVGMVNNRYFMYVCAVGTFTDISYRTKQRQKRILGRLAYAFEGAKDLINPKIINISLKINSETKELSGPLILVLNSISVGGIPFNKNGHLNDGNFDIVVVKKGISRGLINIAKLFLGGIGKKRIRKHYEAFKASEFDIETSEYVTWCIDGEKGMNGNVHIKNLHNHLKIYVPEKNNKHFIEN